MDHNLSEIGPVVKKLFTNPQKIMFLLMRKRNPGRTPAWQKKYRPMLRQTRSEAKNAMCAGGNAFSKAAAAAPQPRPRISGPTSMP